MEILAWASARPVETMLVVLSVLLFLSQSMQRADLLRRLSECEDAHLERDRIQIDAVQLMAEQAGQLKSITGGRRNQDKAIEFEARAQRIVDSVHSLNQQMIDRRNAERRKSEWWLRVLPRLLGHHGGDGGGKPRNP